MTKKFKRYGAIMLSTHYGEMGDLYHLAATLCGLLYETGSHDAQIKALMPEKNIDALCGWAGDFQTAMIDAQIAVGEKADYDTFKKAMDDLIGCESKEKVYKKYPGLEALKEKGEDIHFPKDDMYTDADAVNIFFLIRENMSYNNCLEKSLKYYYSVGYKNRFTDFKRNAIDNIDVKQFTELRFMENGFEAIQEEALMHPIFPGIVFGLMVKHGDKIIWPLFKVEKDNEDDEKVIIIYTFTKEQSLAAYIAFSDYLKRMVENEGNQTD